MKKLFKLITFNRLFKPALLTIVFVGTLVGVMSLQKPISVLAAYIQCYPREVPITDTTGYPDQKSCEANYNISCTAGEGPICSGGDYYRCVQGKWVYEGDCGPGTGEKCEPNGSFSCINQVKYECKNEEWEVVGSCTSGDLDGEEGDVCTSTEDCNTGLICDYAGYGSTKICRTSAYVPPKPECSFSCVSSSACQTEGGDPWDGMSCGEGSNMICCDLPGDDGDGFDACTSDPNATTTCCNPGSRYCAENKQYVCNGYGYTVTSCSAGCENGACAGTTNPSICSAASGSCAGKTFGTVNGSCTCQPTGSSSNLCSCQTGTGGPPGAGTCGDGACSTTETATSCPADCTTTTSPPGTGGQCPNGAGEIAYCVSFNCPNGDTTGEGECNVDDEGATMSGWQSGTDCPRYACGQLDYYTEKDKWNTYCGHEWLGDFPNCGGGGGGGGESPNPSGSNPPPGPQCVNIRKDKENPQVGDQVVFTCGNVSGADHYKFRVVKGDGTILPLEATGRNSEPFSIAEAGSYTAQCTFCKGSRDRSCEPFERLSNN